MQHSVQDNHYFVTYLQVLIGVHKYILGLIYAALTPLNRKKLNELVRSVKLPIEFHRRPRSLEELCRWKATEHKQFLQHIAPILLQDIASVDEHIHFVSLSVGIRLLLTSTISNEDLQLADTALAYFNDKIVSIYGRYSQRYNVHAVWHLVWQVRKCGPLWSHSTFGFESANHFLKMLLSGTVNQAGVIAKRYATRQLLQAKPIANDRLRPLLEKMFRITNKTKDVTRWTKVTAEVQDKIAILLALWRCKDAIVHGRLLAGSFELHSGGYTRRRDLNDSIVQFRDGESIVYGEVVIFVTLLGCTLALISQYNDHEDMFSHIGALNIPENYYIRVKLRSRNNVWISQRNLLRKCCVILKTSECICISPITEHTEHN